MRVLLLVVMVKMVSMELQEPTLAAQQIVTFRQETKCPIGVMTTSAGAPIEYHDATNTLNRPLIFNEHFMDSLTHVVRERIAERAVHAKGAGGFGYFEVTHDVTDFCKARLFSAIGKKTPIGIRFSPDRGEKGSFDASRDMRGFAVKFYTEDGNLDILGLSVPIFMIKDPIHFPSFVRARRRNPATNMYDNNMLWDFMTYRPEAFYFFMRLFGDGGIPKGYRHMPGFSVHTFQLVNQYGNMSFARFHFLPDAGIENLLSEEAAKINAVDPDYFIGDLYNAIRRGEFPGWTMKVQVLSPEDVKSAGFDVFDVTKELPLDKFPLRSVGRLVLNQNLKNYFAEMEHLALSPGNLVPGILGAPDKIFEARRLAYRDAQYHRLGGNYNNIKVNRPLNNKQMTYNRNGVPPLKHNGMDMPNYYPNSFNGPAPYKDDKRIDLIQIAQDDANNFKEAAEYYSNEISEEERGRMIENILSSLQGVIEETLEKTVKIFKIIHSDLGTRVQQGLQGNKTKYKS